VDLLGTGDPNEPTSNTTPSSPTSTARTSAKMLRIRGSLKACIVRGSPNEKKFDHNVERLQQGFVRER
jgi:hypothetical protein